MAGCAGSREPPSSGASVCKQVLPRENGVIPKLGKLEALKQQRRQTSLHLKIKDLLEGQKFEQLRTTKKHFVDTVTLISYRAETALVQVVCEKLAREDDARALVRQVPTTTVDLQPNLQEKTLTVRLHRLTTQVQDAILTHRCQELTATETVIRAQNCG